jgi:hypothetical protein
MTFKAVSAGLTVFVLLVVGLSIAGAPGPRRSPPRRPGWPGICELRRRTWTQALRSGCSGSPTRSAAGPPRPGTPAASPWTGPNAGSDGQPRSGTPLRDRGPDPLRTCRSATRGRIGGCSATSLGRWRGPFHRSVAEARTGQGVDAQRAAGCVLRRTHRVATWQVRSLRSAVHTSGTLVPVQPGVPRLVLGASTVHTAVCLG